jgi:hypothetical protein
VGRLAALALGVLTLATPLACKHHEDPPPQALPGVSPAQMKAEADRMILDGQRLREQGIALRARGNGGDDDLIRRGEQMMAEGQRLRDRAMMLQTP